jgi:photosystem II stability/assembly factor-like uncharacterized protein
MLIFISKASYAQTESSWIQLNSGVDEQLSSLYFVDSLKGWIVGDSGVILHTSNGGLNWIQQDSRVTNSMQNVFFIDENTGWALSWKLFTSGGNEFGTVIHKTTDGGQNWIDEFYPQEDTYINTIYFVNSMTGWMGGYPGFLVYTTDGGEKWVDAHIDSSFSSGFPPLKFTFYNSQYGFACGGIIDLSGVIWTTTDGGQNWTSEPVGPEPIQDMHFFDSLNIIGVGGDFEYGSGIVKSTDGGRSWDYKSLNVYGIASSLSFRTSSEGWAPLGFAQKFIYTTNSGTDWIDINSPDSSIIYDIQFTDSVYAYACGENGVILKYINSGVGINNNLQTPFSYKLYQNYPNPFNPTTTISYDIRENGFVRVKIFDINGREVRNYDNGFKPSGNYTMIFNADGLTSGVYYYNIIFTSSKGTNQITETKKMVLLK